MGQQKSLKGDHMEINQVNCCECHLQYNLQYNLQ
jgi:hypothetical protein